MDERLTSLGVPHVCKVWGTDQTPLYHIFHVDIAHEVAVQCNIEQCDYLKKLL